MDPAIYPFVELYPNTHIETIVPITPEFICESILSPLYSAHNPQIRISHLCAAARAYSSNLHRRQATSHARLSFFQSYEPDYPAVRGPTKAMTLEELKLRSVKVALGQRVACKRLRLILSDITLILI